MCSFLLHGPLLLLYSAAKSWSNRRWEEKNKIQHPTYVLIVYIRRMESFMSGFMSFTNTWAQHNICSILLLCMQKWRTQHRHAKPPSDAAKPNSPILLGYSCSRTNQGSQRWQKGGTTGTAVGLGLQSASLCDSVWRYDSMCVSSVCLDEKSSPILFLP